MSHSAEDPRHGFVTRGELEGSRTSPVSYSHALAGNRWINLSGSSWGMVTSESFHLKFRGEGVLEQRLQLRR